MKTLSQKGIDEKMQKKEFSQFTNMLEQSKIEIINKQIDFDDEMKLTLTTKPTESVIKHVDSNDAIIVEKKMINKIILRHIATISMFNDKETDEQTNLDKAFPLSQLQSIRKM